ncbi:MAG: helix-turn-helix transcriptional regulator [Spirochaetales bacterium]|nr:helix-turn-helix transcriptional regulator [Spirochaetales bacterium]
MIFSIFIIFKVPIQVIQTFLDITDAIAGTIILSLLFSFRKEMMSSGLNSSAFLLWFVCGCAQIIFELLFLFSFIPGEIAIIIRFIFFFICAMYTAIFQPWKKTKSIDKAAVMFGLSPREKDVLGLIMEGKTNDLIAEELFISLSTVKTHVARIFEKTGARNRLEAASLCRKS